MNPDTSSGGAAKSQVQVVVEQVEAANKIPQPKTTPETKVVFNSPLNLNREQEGRLIDHALARVESLEKSLGRNNTSQHNWYGSGENETIKQAAGSFMGKRQLYEMTYHNQLDWRRTLIGGIFSESNLTVPMSRRIAQQQISRSVNYFLGTDPWFGAYPVSATDEGVAGITDSQEVRP